MLEALAHLLAVAAALKVLKSILPSFITDYYTCAAICLMTVLVAKATFNFTKKTFLAERIQPDNKAVLITGKWIIKFLNVTFFLKILITCMLRMLIIK